MPLFVEHLRADAKSHPDNRRWEPVEHAWTEEYLLQMGALIEEDGGPPQAHGSGYGIFSDRKEVDHTFTQDYTFPDGRGIRVGDRVRMWRGR